MGKPAENKGVIFAGMVLFLAFLLPNHYSPWLSFHQELGVAIAFVPLIISACVLQKKISLLTIGVMFLAVMPWIQEMFGQLYFSGDAWMHSLYILGFALAVHAGCWVVSRPNPQNSDPLERFMGVWLGITLAGIVSVGIAGHQWLLLRKLGVFIADLPPGGRPFANLAQPNHLATLLLLSITGVMFMWEGRKLTALTALVATFVLIFGLVMTGSRFIWLTIMWLVPAYCFLRRRCKFRTTPATFIILIIIYVVLSLAWPSINRGLHLDVDVISSVERLAKSDSRLTLWYSMIDALGRSPWVGYGWGQIGLAQTVTALDHPSTNSFFESSHNLVLDLALWNGIPIALVVVFGAVFWFVHQLRRSSSPLTAVTLMALGSITCHAMVEFPLHYAYFLLPAGFMIGGISGLSSKGLGLLSFGNGLRLRAGMWCVGGVVFSVFVMTVKEYLPYEENWRAMRFKELGIGNMQRVEPPPVYLLTQLRELMSSTQRSPALGMTAEEVELTKNVSERYAYPSSMFRYALVQALNNDPHGAEDTLLRICKMHTKNTCSDAQRQWKAEVERYRFEANLVSFPDLPSGFFR